MNDAPNLMVEATMERVTSLSDGGLSVTFHTQELNAEQKTVVIQHHRQFGYLLFRPNKYNEDDVPDVDAKRSDFKTPSQRLREVFYALAMTKGVPKWEFEQWYIRQMEVVIEQVKKQFDSNSPKQ